MNTILLHIGNFALGTTYIITSQNLCIWRTKFFRISDRKDVFKISWISFPLQLCFV